MFRGIYPHDDAPAADLILMEVDDVANQLGILHFLWHGTCLGIVRDGIYPETDPDIDVGILATEEERELLFQTLVDRGYEMEGAWLGQNRHFYKNNFTMDIFYKFPARYNMVLQEFESVHYNGRIYNIPFPVESYLQMEYGGNWQTKANWIWMNGWHK